MISGAMQGKYMEHYKNGIRRIHIKNYKYCDDIKWYDCIGNLDEHVVKHMCRWYDCIGTLDEHKVKHVCGLFATLRASYQKNIIHTYYWQTSLNAKFYIIRRDPNKFFINTSFINHIRHIQKRIRSKLYAPILNILREMFDINDIAQIILSYHTKN
jgi:hypothetical protein